MRKNYKTDLGKILLQQRLMIPLTLHQLSLASGVSISHLGRIEKGERYPSATILQKLAKPLGFEENDLFTLAGYLSAQTPMMGEKKAEYTGRNVDPEVIKILAQEPVEVQRAVIGILKILKSMAANLSQKTNNKTKS